jgi:hypothetical protein
MRAKTWIGWHIRNSILKCTTIKLREFRPARFSFLVAIRNFSLPGPRRWGILKKTPSPRSKRMSGLQSTPRGSDLLKQDRLKESTPMSGGLFRPWIRGSGIALRSLRAMRGRSDYIASEYCMMRFTGLYRNTKPLGLASASMQCVTASLYSLVLTL